MITIPAATGEQGFVAMNVFTVKPENQQQLIDRIRAGGSPADVPGLLSMNLLRSEDGTQVVNLMQWESRPALEHALANNAQIAATMKEVMKLVEGASPGHYEVIEV